jgi:putative hydrolase of the HAD superfamily
VTCSPSWACPIRARAGRPAGWLTAYRDAQLQATVAFEDVAATLGGCAGYVRGAVTNNDGAWQRTRLAHVGLHDPIAAVIGIDDAGAAKPDARIFHAGCTALGLEPGEVAYVGDDLALDARGAAAAGLYGIWLDRPGAGPDPIDVPWIRSLGELPEVLTRFGASRGVR